MDLIGSLPVAPVRVVYAGLVEAGANFAAIAAILGVVALAWKWPVGPLVRGARYLSRRIDLFLSDWFGVEDRDGVPGRPGVMAQLADQRDTLAEQSATLAAQHDSWSSLRDKVQKIERDLLSLRSQVTWLMGIQGKTQDKE